MHDGNSDFPHFLAPPAVTVKVSVCNIYCIYVLFIVRDASRVLYYFIQIQFGRRTFSRVFNDYQSGGSILSSSDLRGRRDRQAIVVTMSEIIEAYVRSNIVAAHLVPGLMRDIHGVLLDVAALEPVRQAGEPTVPETVGQPDADHVVCLDCGRWMQMLKRHVFLVHGMGLQQYRLTWGLPADAPMVAAQLAGPRSHLAKASGLGHRRYPVAREYG
jgi:predicted transcriptional regulator